MTDTEYWREATNPRFWKQILDERAALIQSIVSRLTAQNSDNPSALSSLAVAQRRHAEVRPSEFVSFTEAWLTSLASWRGQLPVLSWADLPDQARAIEKALAKLGLANVVRAHEPTGGGGWIGGFASRWGRRAGTDARRLFEEMRTRF